MIFGRQRRDNPLEQVARDFQLTPDRRRRNAPREQWSMMAEDLKTAMALLTNKWFGELHGNLLQGLPNPPRFVVDSLDGDIKNRIALCQIAAVADRIRAERYLREELTPGFIGVLAEKVLGEAAPGESSRLQGPSREVFNRVVSGLSAILPSYLFGPEFHPGRNEATFTLVTLHLYARTESIAAIFFGDLLTGSKIMLDFEALARRMGHA